MSTLFRFAHNVKSMLCAKVRERWFGERGGVREGNRNLLNGGILLLVYPRLSAKENGPLMCPLIREAFVNQMSFTSGLDVDEGIFVFICG